MNHWEHEHLLNPSCRPGTGDSRGQPLSLRSQERVRETFSVKGQAIVWPVWSIRAGDCHPTLPLGNKSNHRQHANKTLFTKQAVGPVAPSWSVRTSGLERMWTMKHNWRHCGRCYEKALGGVWGRSTAEVTWLCPCPSLSSAAGFDHQLTFLKKKKKNRNFKIKLTFVESYITHFVAFLKKISIKLFWFPFNSLVQDLPPNVSSRK